VKFTLRDYEPADLEALYEIDQACYPAEIAYSKGELRAYLGISGADCVVAEANDAIAGFCISIYQNARGYIVTIDVLNQFRRTGIGSALLREVERRLAAQGAREVGLETATDNESAVAFWRKHGYRSLGIRKNYYPGGRDAFAMSKAIPSLPDKPGELV
jgi:[ribosomal protein S18]-alanine N-acetyltransferase